MTVTLHAVTGGLVRSFVLLMMACVTAVAQTPHAHNQLSARDRADGWVLLFDGATTKGWLEITGDPFPPTWRVEDGCLRTIVHPDSFQDIRTEGEWKSFEMTLEWKIAPKGNSGIKYLIPKVDKWKSRTGGDGFHARARGFEYQLADDAGNDDAKSTELNSTASLYGFLAPPKNKPVKPAGEWNETRLMVRDDHVEHWLNGMRTVEYELGGSVLAETPRAKTRPDAKELLAAAKRVGPISLQHHDSEVWFRCVKLRPLK